MAQLTALDWFIESLPNRFRNTILNECSEDIEKAKAMEKEKIINARINGDENHSLIGNKRKRYAEQYYNETYNK